MAARSSTSGWCGGYRPHAHLSVKNVANGVLMAIALLPSFVLAICRRRCPTEAASLAWWCTVADRSPILAVNALFFLNVSVGFYIVGLAQRSFWLIDPYWTLIPPMIGAYYATEETAHVSARVYAANALVLVWSIRLTHSYFRREEWRFGQREDWRYTAMAEKAPRLWWIKSFFVVGLAQQPMLVGLTLPLWAVTQTS